MVARLLDLLAPPACLACAAPTAGTPLCGPCAAAVPWLVDPCPRCALPRPCAPCPAAEAPFARAWAPVAHAGPARELVLALKLRGLPAAADAMAAQIAAGVPRELVADAVLVPVPAARGRRRRRGLDPVDRLAAALGRRLDRPVERWLRTVPGAAGRQVGRGRQARLAGTHGRFAAAPTVPPAPPPVVVVDDVHTTGATLTACALALRAAGVGHVAAVTYARTLRPG